MPSKLGGSAIALREVPVVKYLALVAVLVLVLGAVAFTIAAVREAVGGGWWNAALFAFGVVLSLDLADRVRRRRSLRGHG